jgi:HPt (histidine-containing phosphotransfer) domain-containing protein
MERPPSARCCEPGLLLEAVAGDAAVFGQLAQLFLHETVARFHDIARFSAAGRLAEMGHEAHSLKGTAATVGAAELVQLLQQIERAGLQDRQPCSAGQLFRLDMLLQRARDDVNAFLADLPGC